MKAKEAVQKRHIRLFLHKRRTFLLEKLGGDIPAKFEGHELIIIWLHYLQVLLCARRTVLEDEIRLLSCEKLTQSEDATKPMFIHKIPAREDIKSKVFTPFHRSPTMKISELLKREMEMGNIITDTTTKAKDANQSMDPEEDIYALRKLDAYRDGMSVLTNF